jgi:protein gp37
MAARGLPGLNSPTTGEPFAIMTPQGPRWTGKVELIESQLDVPLRWRKPRRIFVNSMSDTFHDSVSREDIATLFGIMAVAGAYEKGENPLFGQKYNQKRGFYGGMGPHTFLVLTKRGQRMREVVGSPWFQREAAYSAYKWAHDRRDAGYLSDRIWQDSNSAWCAPGRHGRLWPLPNVWLGVSVEDQTTADERIPHLLATPAAVRFLSVEPLLGPVDLSCWLKPEHWTGGGLDECGPGAYYHREDCPCNGTGVMPQNLHWVIVGGESGTGARPCRLEWIRSIVQQCAAAGVPCFVKQIGSRPEFASDHWPEGLTSALWSSDLGVYDYPATKKGGDPTEWPDDLRVRQFPEARNA